MPIAGDLTARFGRGFGVVNLSQMRKFYSESGLEAALIHRLEDFLLELGDDSTFVGRQRRLRFEELTALTFGKLGDDNGAKTAAIAKAIVQLKKDSLKNQPREGIDETRITVDTPISFSIHELWLDLYR